MEIFINTDNHITNSDEFTDRFTEVVENKLRKFSQYFSRVEVYFSDENEAKGGPEDKRCTIELRIIGKQPVVASHTEATLEAAMRGCLDKAERIARKEISRMNEHRA